MSDTNSDTIPTASIIIPFYNEWQLTHQRLMDLYKFAPEYCEIILVDDASPEVECGNGITWWQQNARHKVRYYKNPENVGFGQSNNNGAKLAKSKYLILLSNDVVIYDNFITDIVDLIGIDDKMLVAGRIVDWAGGWNEFDIDGRHYVIPYAEGWLIGCTKVAWKGLGGFDPIYGKFDYEDVGLTMQALSLGYNIVNLNSSKVKHLGSQTISKLNIDRQSITENNREKFLLKWKEKIPILIT
jgi:GT2 family glycosyltransferase